MFLANYNNPISVRKNKTAFKITYILKAVIDYKMRSTNNRPLLYQFLARRCIKITTFSEFTKGGNECRGHPCWRRWRDSNPRDATNVNTSSSRNEMPLYRLINQFCTNFILNLL